MPVFPGPRGEVARDYRSENGSAIFAGFAELLSIPNVASYNEGIGRNAVYIRDQFRERGIDMELLTLPDVPPIIFGEITRPNATRTLAIYVHYDGQPADPTQWAHAPWEATLYTAAMEEGGEPRPFPKPGEEIDPEWRLYARSAGDDKAPIAALLAVLDAFRESDIAITSNIKFFFEGEEDAGSARRGPAPSGKQKNIALYLSADIATSMTSMSSFRVRPDLPRTVKPWTVAITNRV